MKKFVAALLLFVSPFAAYASPKASDLKTQGATYQSKIVTPASATAGLSSTSYAVSMNGQVIMHLTLTIAAPGAGPFQVALTAARAET